MQRTAFVAMLVLTIGCVLCAPDPSAGEVAKPEEQRQVEPIRALNLRGELVAFPDIPEKAKTKEILTEKRQMLDKLKTQLASPPKYECAQCGGTGYIHKGNGIKVCGACRSSQEQIARANAELEKQINSLQDEITRLESTGENEDLPPLDLAVGKFGKLRELSILQVLGKRDVLATVLITPAGNMVKGKRSRLSVSARSQCREVVLRIKGLDTTKLTDDSDWVPEGEKALFVVVGTSSYSTVAGGTKTVLLVLPLELVRRGLTKEEFTTYSEKDTEK